jgi:pimeloyl-ACP methyl ester carboxylesterase
VAWPPQEFSIERAALHVQRVIERLEAGPVFAVGAFMGAAIALRLALNAPPPWCVDSPSSVPGSMPTAIPKVS